MNSEKTILPGYYVVESRDGGTGGSASIPEIYIIWHTWIKTISNVSLIVTNIVLHYLKTHIIPILDRCSFRPVPILHIIILLWGILNYIIT